MNEEYLVNHNEEIMDEFEFEFVELVVQDLGENRNLIHFQIVRFTYSILLN